MFSSQNIFTCKLFGRWDGSKHLIGFPPPVMLGLRELGLPVVAVGVGPLCVDAGAGKRSVKSRAANDPLVFAITEMAPPSSSSSKEDVQK